MVGHKGYSSVKDPLFVGSNYAFWKVGLGTYILSLDTARLFVQNSYQVLEISPTYMNGEALYSYNEKDKIFILCGLSYKDLSKCCIVNFPRKLGERYKEIMMKTIK